MVFKPDFSFNPRPVTPTGPRSRSVSPKASCGRTPCLEDGEVSPSSNDPSVMSAWSSKRSSMTSITYSLRRECHPSISTAYSESIIESKPVISPIRIRFDAEGYGYGEDSDDEVEKKGKASAIKASILRGFHPFPFHNKTKKAGSAPTSPKSPETPPVRTSTKQNNQNTRATVNARFRLFKSAPKSTRNNRRPPPLDLQCPSKVSTTPIKGAEKPLASPIKLDTSVVASEYHNFTKSPEAGVQLLCQTLSEESDQEGTLKIKHPKERKGIFRSRGCTPHKDITPAYIVGPWFTTSQGLSPMPEVAERIETATVKFPKSYLPLPPKNCEEILKSPTLPPLSPKSQQQPAAVSTSTTENVSSVPASPVIQPPTPRSAGSTMSFLFDEDEETDIEDSPANFYTRKPSPATSRRSSLSVSRSSSVSGSRKSSVATFFCRGQRPSFDRQNSIGLGGLTGDEVEIVDDAESIFYPGIGELKSKSSWLYTNPPDYYSSDDEDDDDSEIEEAYQRHISLITQIRKNSTSSLASSVTSTPELTMSSSVSSESSYGQMLATPSRRRNRRRTASSECIVLEALEEMKAVGLKDLEGVEKQKSRGLGFLGDVDFDSEWADTLWEMDSDEQAGWDWGNQQMALIGI